MRTYLGGVKLGTCLARCFSTTPLLYCSKGQNLSALSMLRKKTGISISRVKHALTKFNNDTEEAEKWLLAEARKEGWTRAQKLQGRPMSQGLIGLINVQGTATMVEVNCETDFVAKNAIFQELVTAATMACLEHGKASGESKLIWGSEELGKLTTADGVPLDSLLADKIGSLLENIALRRAAFLKPPHIDTFTGAYIHFAGQDIMAVPRDVLMGRYAGLVSFSHRKPLLPEEDQDADRLSYFEVGNQLAQHVVGMNPQKIGDPETDQPHRNREKETKMIFQEFLQDEDLTVQQFLAENQATVLDFVRFGLGEEEQQVFEEEEEDREDEMTGVVEENEETKIKHEG